MMYENGLQVDRLAPLALPGGGGITVRFVLLDRTNNTVIRIYTVIIGDSPITDHVLCFFVKSPEKYTISFVKLLIDVRVFQCPCCYKIKKVTNFFPLLSKVPLVRSQTRYQVEI